MSQTSGVTYEKKPAFIDRMIEVGSQHFFKSFGYLNFAAAEAEDGENIGISSAAGDNAKLAVWHLRKALELYGALITSIEPLPVSARAKEIIQNFQGDSLRATLAGQGRVMTDTPQWTQFVSSVKRGDPVDVIKDFVERMRAIQDPLERVSYAMQEGKMEPPNLHSCITKYLEALLFGQYIAEFNRNTRDS